MQKDHFTRPAPRNPEVKKLRASLAGPVEQQENPSPLRYFPLVAMLLLMIVDLTVFALLVEANGPRVSFSAAPSAPANGAQVHGTPSPGSGG